MTEVRSGRFGEETNFPLTGFEHRRIIGDRVESKMLQLSSHVFPFVQLGLPLMLTPCRNVEILDLTQRKDT